MEKSVQRVREAAAGLRKFSESELWEKLDVRTFADGHQVKNALSWLKRTGEVIMLGIGIYEYRERKNPLPVFIRLWRAMCIRKVFTQSDLIFLTGASKDYVKKYCAFLKKKGFLWRGAKRRGHYGCLYHLLECAPSIDDAPNMVRK